MLVSGHQAEQLYRRVRERRQAAPIGFGFGLTEGWGVSSGIVTALNYVTSNVLAYHRADLLVTQSGTVSVWGDYSGNGHDLSQAAPGQRPAYGATAGPNNTPAITGDGVDDLLVNTTLDLPAPATTNTTVWMIVKAITWTANDTFIMSPGGSFQAACAFVQITSSPQACMTNESLGPTASLTLGTWFCVEMLYTGSTSDALRINNGAPITGVASANVNPAVGRHLFGRGTGGFTSYANAAIAEVLHVAGALTTQQRTDLATIYRPSRYAF